MLRELISGSVTFRPLGRPLGELFVSRSQATVRLVVAVVAAIDRLDDGAAAGAVSGRRPAQA